MLRLHVHDLVTRWDRDASTPAQYVGYASGGNYQDLEILVRALTRRPNANLTVHLVDRLNRYSIQLRDALKFSHKVAATDSIDLFHEDVRAVVDRLVTADGNPGAVYATQFASGVEHNEARHVQMLDFLRRAFPSAIIELSMHDTAEG